MRLDLRNLGRAIARLPEEQRSAIRLIGLEGVRYEEAASAQTSRSGRSVRGLPAAVKTCGQRPSYFLAGIPKPPAGQRPIGIPCGVRWRLEIISWMSLRRPFRRPNHERSCAPPALWLKIAARAPSRVSRLDRYATRHGTALHYGWYSSTSFDGSSDLIHEGTDIMPSQSSSNPAHHRPLRQPRFQLTPAAENSCVVWRKPPANPPPPT